MYALFKIGWIEDHYRVRKFVAVSEDRQRLEDYVEKEKSEYARIKALRERFAEIKKSLPSFDLPAPVKMKAPFVPKTKEEHAFAAALSQDHRKEHRLWQELAGEHETNNRRQAFDMLGADQRDEAAVTGWDFPYGSPEFEIEEAEVW